MGASQRGVVVIALGIFATPASAQVPVRILTQRVSALTQGFTRIAAVHELRDNRMILLDADDRSVHAVSADFTAANPIGRIGAGPGEYLLPSRLLPLVGDSTAIYDGPNSRLLIITPDAQPAGMVDLRFSGSGASTPATRPPSPTRSDGFGRLYARASPVRALAAGELELVDSAAIQRWVIGGQRDTAGFISVRASNSMLVAGMVVSRPLPPYAPATIWTVAPDGHVAVVYPDPYRIVFYAPDGAKREGPVIPAEPIKVTESHKQAYRDDAERPRPSVVVRRGEAGSTVASIRLPFKEPAEWPEFMPPFLSRGTVEFAPNGNLWVERTTASPDGPLVYDVIDRFGRLVEQIQVPAGTRLIGFGVESVYLVRRDAYDLEYLERYRLTATEPESLTQRSS